MLKRALGLLVALTACTVEFPPPRAGDGGPSGTDLAGLAPLDLALVDDLAWVDLAPRSDGALPDRPVDRDQLDWTVLPDHPPVDQSVGVDASPPQIHVELQQEPEAGCTPRDVTLHWAANGATGCQLALLDGELHEGLPATGTIELRLTAETSLALVCNGPGGETLSRVPVIFSPALAESLDLLRAPPGIRGAQQRCARALGEYVMDNESEVREDSDSAARLCVCEGYGQRQIVAKSDRCFASPHDNGIVRWRDNAWVRDRASSHNKCITHLRCTRPVTTCAELLYPK